MRTALNAAKILLSPWAPWKDYRESLWQSTSQIYLFFALPIAAIGPSIELILALTAPIHSMIVPEPSPSLLVYIFIRDTICGMATIYCYASIIYLWTAYFGAKKEKLQAHQLAAITVTPVLLAVAIRPFFLSSTLVLEAVAITYGGYLLGSGVFIKLDVRRVWATLTYTVVVLVWTTVAISIGESVLMCLQRLVWQIFN